MYMEENKIYLLNQIDLSKIIYSKVNEMNDKKLIHIFYINFLIPKNKNIVNSILYSSSIYLNMLLNSKLNTNNLIIDIFICKNRNKID